MKHWYNNGKIVKYCEVCPEGFVAGRLNKKLNAAEQKNVDLVNELLNKISAEELINFYKAHTVAETVAEFNTTEFILKRALQQVGYDFSFKKVSTLKGKKSCRSKESYVTGGQKSANTQKQHWQEKTEEEKEAWSEKQKEAHSSQEFREKISAINKEYNANLTYEERCERNAKKSKSAKNIWASLSPEKQKSIQENRFKNGRCYNSKNSKPNSIFANLLTENNINFDTEFCLDQKRFDFKIDNLLIEIDPWSTHNSTVAPFECKRGPLNKIYHKAKTETANKYNYRCIHVFDWDNINKILMLIKNDKKIIYGRECTIKEISRQDAATFINNYHLQNYAIDSIRLGLFFEDNLVSVMTFRKPRYNKKYEYELIRYCSSSNVFGGAEKLFNYFLKKYNPQSVISYCDLSKFSGNTYTKLNFKLINKPAPSLHWYNPQTKEHYTDNLLRQQGFSRLIHHCDAKDDNLPTNDNKVLMILAGFVEVYDCGQATYIWQKKA